MTTKNYHLGDILSITHDRLLSPRHIEGVYDILGFMTGETLFTHQLPRAGRECKPVLLAQLPQLAEIDAENVNAGNWKGWLAEQVTKYGETLPVAPLPKREPKYDTPLGDLVEMVGGNTDKIIAVEL